MQNRIAAVLGAAAMIGAAIPASAADLPAIKVAESNPVPACATPGRLASFLKSRNAKLDARFEGIATEYMRHGEELGIRWDFAFFQMLLETGNLGFSGTVQPSQNNFAGLGATGRREPGETFKDVATGVRAHLEHVLMYSGQHIDNPVAERTRKVQEWGVLTGWQKSIKGPMTYTQLARQWAPKSRNYVSDIDSVAGAFYDGPCKASDPHPELVQEARAGRGTTPAATKVAAAPETSPTPHEIATETRKRAVEEQRAEGAKRAGLGALKLPEPPAAKPEPQAKAQPAVTILNGAKPEAPKAQPEESTTAPAAAAKGAAVHPTAVAPLAKQQPPAAKEAPAKGKCNVWTASYGGQKAIIIKAAAPDATNYTVLDVNEGSEKREAEAYIAAYAKGGQMLGEFLTSDQALDKAFELCPEG